MISPAQSSPPPYTRPSPGWNMIGRLYTSVVLPLRSAGPGGCARPRHQLGSTDYDCWHEAEAE
jgi:hypothetical protein